MSNGNMRRFGANPPPSTDLEEIHVGVHEAKTNLSRLLKLVEAGREVVINRGGVPVARLIAASPYKDRQFGLDAGQYEVPADFDAPLPDSELDNFYS